MQSLSFPENRFVTSGTERRYYRWRRSVHQTTRPACMARPDPLWGRSCRDFSTLRDRRGSCGYRSITGACEDACPESPKDHKKRISTDISNGNDQLIYTERTADFYFRDSIAPPTRNEDSARSVLRNGVEKGPLEDYFQDDTRHRIRKEDVKINAVHDNVNCGHIWKIIIRLL